MPSNPELFAELTANDLEFRAALPDPAIDAAMPAAFGTAVSAGRFRAAFQYSGVANCDICSLSKDFISKRLADIVHLQLVMDAS